jgi:phosphopantothenoylcysteine decarboxylase/phosphopantothenate--cysteine ligase
MNALQNKKILLIIAGGIAAYKALELIRLIRKSGGDVTCILSNGGSRFITPLSAAALSENPVYTDLWSLKDETEMGHIRLSREADLIIAAPASANLIGKIACGLGDDLASTVLLASDKPLMIAPAMNPEMWAKPAVQRNMNTLRADGVTVIGPATGDTACGESGIGRMSEPSDILESIAQFFAQKPDARPLTGKKAIVTSGPTHEPIDPVRYVGNRSSGKQGHAIAAALARSGAEVTLISGPVYLPDPNDVKTVHVETALQMYDAAMNALPADIAVCAAAVADWRPAFAQTGKISKQDRAGAAPDIRLHENPDTLKDIAAHKQRPALVIGFAAETSDAANKGIAKRTRKGCDWIIANLAGTQDAMTFGENENHVHFIDENGAQEWPRASKDSIAERIVQEIEKRFTHDDTASKNQ